MPYAIGLESRREAPNGSRSIFPSVLPQTDRRIEDAVYSTAGSRDIFHGPTLLYAFSDGEICVLENHGYLLAEVAMRRHAADLVDSWPAPRLPTRVGWTRRRRVARSQTARVPESSPTTADLLAGSN
jgi:hypothetical protein